MPLAQVADYTPPIELYRIFDQTDEATTSQFYARGLSAKLGENSAFWQGVLRLAEARQRAKSAMTLERGWDTYGAEPPNAVAAL